VIIEVVTSEFLNESSKIITFSSNFTKIPKVIANTKGATDSNYNVSIAAVTRTSVTIGISQVYTGTVTIHAIGS
jgi:hypothetical protein